MIVSLLFSARGVEEGERDHGWMLGWHLKWVLLQKCLNHAMCRSMQVSSKQHGCEKLSLLARALLVHSDRVRTSWPRGQEQVWAVTGQAGPRASEGSWVGNTGVGFVAAEPAGG